MAEDWCGILVELALYGFTSIGSDRSDVNQPDNAIIGSGSSDDGPAIRVADKDGRAADAPQRAFRCGDVTCECVKAILGGDHLVPLRLKRGNHFAEARAVGPDTVAEHDACFGLHISLPPME